SAKKSYQALTSYAQKKIRTQRQNELLSSPLKEAKDHQKELRTAVLNYRKTKKDDTAGRRKALVEIHTLLGKLPVANPESTGDVAGGKVLSPFIRVTGSHGRETLSLSICTVESLTLHCSNRNLLTPGAYPTSNDYLIRSETLKIAPLKQDDYVHQATLQGLQ